MLFKHVGCSALIISLTTPTVVTRIQKLDLRQGLGEKGLNSGCYGRKGKGVEGEGIECADNMGASDVAPEPHMNALCFG